MIHREYESYSGGHEKSAKDPHCAFLILPTTYIPSARYASNEQESLLHTTLAISRAAILFLWRLGRHSFLHAPNAAACPAFFGIAPVC